MKAKKRQRNLAASFSTPFFKYSSPTREEINAELNTEQVRQLLRTALSIATYAETDSLVSTVTLHTLKNLGVSSLHINGGGFVQIVLGGMKKRKRGVFPFSASSAWQVPCSKHGDEQRDHVGACIK